MSTSRPLGVGSQTLLHGDNNAGYYGEVTGLITANELRTKLGVTQGIAMQTGDIKFLKYSHNEKTLYIPEKPLQHSISWDHLQSKDLVFGKTLEINGSIYLVRLMQGSSINPATNYSGGTPPTSVTGQNSEWDSLLVPSVKNWDIATEDALGLISGNGRYNWCQEVHSANVSYRVSRGYGSVSYFSSTTSSTSGTSFGWRPVLELLVDLNASPIIIDSTENNKIFYEQESLSINGTVKDTDDGDIVSVKYKINNGAIRAIATGISNGTTPLAYSKSLKYTDNKLFDGATEVANGLIDGQTYNIKIWGEDDKGGKSVEVTRNFTVVPNRPPVLSINSIITLNDKINSEVLQLSGNVTDADNNNVVVSLKINDKASVQIYEGVPSTFNKEINIGELKEGENTLVITAKDTFDFVVTKTVKINKTRNSTKLKEAIARYKINPPSGSAKQILAWVQKEIGDLTVDADISMVLEGENESYTSMTKLTAPIDGLIEENEFAHEELELKDNITLKLKLTKVDENSTKSIKQISGVLK